MFFKIWFSWIEIIILFVYALKGLLLHIFILFAIFYCKTVKTTKRFNWKFSAFFSLFPHFTLILQRKKNWSQKLRKPRPVSQLPPPLVMKRGQRPGSGYRRMKMWVQSHLSSQTNPRHTVNANKNKILSVFLTQPMIWNLLKKWSCGKIFNQHFLNDVETSDWTRNGGV